MLLGAERGMAMGVVGGHVERNSPVASVVGHDIGSGRRTRVGCGGRV